MCSSAKRDELIIKFMEVETMREFKAQDIRNIAVLGHSGSGKTSFCEAVLYRAGVTKRLGSVDESNTVMDYSSEEKQRNISINLGVAAMEWQDTKVNLIDTPGDFDFLGEVNEALRVADSAIVVLSGRSGVTVGAEKAFRFLNRENIPYAIFINKLDDEVADFAKTVVQVREYIGRSATQMMLPIKENGHYTGYIDVLNKKAYTYNDDNVREECDIPEDMKADLEVQYNNLIEQVAESSDELLEKYFMEEEFTDEEIAQGLKDRISSGHLIPIWGGSVTQLRGIRFSMNRIVNNMPSPASTNIEPAIKPDGTAVELTADDDGPTAGLIFKTYADPYVGKISFVRLFSGTIDNNQDLWNEKRQASDRAAGLSIPQGAEQLSVDTLHAGDIGIITKLEDAQTGDTLSEKDQPLELPGIVFPASPLVLAIYPEEKGEEDKIALGIAKMQAEDPTIKLEQNKETGEMLVAGLGELQLNVLVSKLENFYDVKAELRSPKVPYREKIAKPVKVQGKYKKQSGGHGQYGDVWIEFSPYDGEDLVFVEEIFGGAVPKTYFPAVEKGLREASQKGSLANYPVVGLKANLVDGSYHDVDSSELAFQIAASMAFRKAMEQAGAYLLEPIYKIVIHVPEDDLGNIMSDISRRRGRIQGIDQKAGMSIVSALVPLSELDRYATDLRAMTQGRGWYDIEFNSYERMPEDMKERVIEARQQEDED